MNNRRIQFVCAAMLAATTVFAQGAGVAGQGQGQGDRQIQRQQRQGQRQFQAGGLVQMAGPRLLLQENVQKELKMTAEQIEKAKTAFGQLGGDRRIGDGQGQGRIGAGQGQGRIGAGQGQNRQQGGQGGQGGLGQGRQGQGLGQGQGQGGAQIRQQLGQRQAEMEKQVKEILDEKQFARYQQLVLQAEGAGALARPEVGQKVGLSQEQMQKIRQMQQEQMQSIRESMQQARQGGGDMEAVREKLMASREELNAKIIGSLTSEQKKSYDALLGPAFNFQQIRVGK